MTTHATDPHGDQTAPSAGAAPDATRHSGIDVAGMDRAVRPQDDLFGFVNGTWVRETQIPEDKGRYGTFDRLRDEAQEHVRALLEEASHAVADEGDRVVR